MSQPASFSLAGKVALVTGANTGLGQGIAVALAQAGADIVGIARSSTVDTERGVQSPPAASFIRCMRISNAVTKRISSWSRRPSRRRGASTS